MTENMTRAEFEIALEAFRAAAEEIVREHFARNDYTFAVPNVEIASRGKRFAKLVSTESDPQTGEKRGQTMVHSFVEIATGDIYKPASFKAPAKHARGNITDNAGRASMSPQGHIIYLR
jgi:hypothetical protein